MMKIIIIFIIMSIMRRIIKVPEIGQVCNVCMDFFFFFGYIGWWILFCIYHQATLFFVSYLDVEIDDNDYWYGWW